MKIKINEIYNCRNALAKLANAQMPISMSYKFARLLKSLNDEYAIIEDQRINLVKQHGEEVNSNEHQIKTDEQKEAFIKDFEVLLQNEIDVEFEKLNIEEMENINISPQELSILSFIFNGFE
jgi:hypothetical protein